MPTAIRARFADFELNLQTGELRRAGVTVPLERQPARLLSLLVERAGDLVCRDELRRAIWGDHTHVDFDRGLNYGMRQIRIALGDDARAPRFIETLPRQGYRFIARPETTGDDRAPVSSPTRSLRRRWAIAAVAAACLVALVEAGPRNELHHEVAVTVARYLHALVF
jgi:DNA-binding winged helix-turn-helix (wHTH) protein